MRPAGSSVGKRAVLWAQFVQHGEVVVDWQLREPREARARREVAAFASPIAVPIPAPPWASEVVMQQSVLTD